MSGWPTIAEEAFHGPGGEFVLRTEPHSEAHPMALLSQFLVAFGTACGRGAHYQVEADRHYSNEFVVLVGPTATGRKGSSWGHVRRLLGDTDPGFAGCLVGGLSSGEGLISQVRDPLEDHHDQAPSDKRRLVVEPEFAQTLKVLAREGNTLSPVVRQAWDGEPLQTMVRNDPLRASDAHIGIVGHITRDELLRYLTATELANGFANRNADPAGMPISRSSSARLTAPPRRPAGRDATDHPTGYSPSSKISDAIMPTLTGANRAFCGEFQTKVGMPAGSALR